MGLRAENWESKANRAPNSEQLLRVRLLLYLDMFHCLNYNKSRIRQYCNNNRVVNIPIIIFRCSPSLPTSGYDIHIRVVCCGTIITTIRTAITVVAAAGSASHAWNISRWRNTSTSADFAHCLQSMFRYSRCKQTTHKFTIHTKSLHLPEVLGFSRLFPLYKLFILNALNFCFSFFTAAESLADNFDTLELAATVEVDEEVVGVTEETEDTVDMMG